MPLKKWWAPQSYPLRGLILCDVILLLTMLGWGTSLLVSAGGKCSLVSALSGGTALACFIAPSILGVCALVPATLVGLVAGWLYGKIKSRR